MNGTAVNAMTDIVILSARTMMDLQAKAQERVDDILDSTMTINELDAWLRHYAGQRQEAVDEGDISAAILAEYILTGLERALAQ